MGNAFGARPSVAPRIEPRRVVIERAGSAEAIDHYTLASKAPSITITEKAGSRQLRYPVLLRTRWKWVGLSATLAASTQLER
jgi:hypothetical protein